MNARKVIARKIKNLQGVLIKLYEYICPCIHICHNSKTRFSNLALTTNDSFALAISAR